jgi:Trk K+ transport system NAD-binding subunit
MILYSHPLYERLAPWLGIFERKNPHRELAANKDRPDDKHPDLIIFGLGRYGGRLALGLKDSGLSIMGVDFDPEISRSYRRKGLTVRFGDGIETDFIESLPLKGVSWVVSTLPDLISNKGLLQALQDHHYQGKIAVVAREEIDGAALKKLGVTNVLLPMNNAVDYAVQELSALIHEKDAPHDSV